MLAEIRCVHFRDGPISFNAGLNVVLGDENATNSIGKSTLLMIVDFAFGGGTLVAHNTDIVKELGDHDYFFTFRFGDQLHRFRRGTNDASVVYVCDAAFSPERAISEEEYTSFLKSAYALPFPDLTFRAAVGLYLRVAGKPNLTVDQPLHATPVQRSVDCIDTLLKLFQQYEAMRTLSADLKTVDQEAGALATAMDFRIVPGIGKREYQANQQRISALTAELADIRVNLAQYATSLSAIVNRDVLQLKLEKDRLLDLSVTISGRLQRVQRNIAESRHIKSAAFRGLLAFFPSINQTRLERIEEFHNELARILRSELRESESELRGQLDDINGSLKEIDAEMSEKLSSVDDPGTIVDKVYEAAVELQETRDANKHYESQVALKAQRSDLRAALTIERDKALSFVERVINDEMRRLVTAAFGAERKSPTLTLHDKRYEFEVFEDTGTGTAYAGFVVLDLTIFRLTALPVLAHDSLLFKNIENTSVARLLQVYLSTEKQSFIAIDEVDKYGADAAAQLRSRAVIHLRGDKVLYTKDWRR